MILNKTILIQAPTAARWAIPGFCEFFGPSSDAVGFSVSLGYGAASMGDWYPTFQDGTVVSKRRASIARRCGAASQKNECLTSTTVTRSHDQPVGTSQCRFTLCN